MDSLHGVVSRARRWTWRLSVSALVIATCPHASAQQPAPQPSPAPPPTSADWTQKIKLSGFIQAQFVSNENSETGVDAQGRPLNAHRFEIRRGRLKLTYTDGPAEGVLHIDATNTGIKLLEAEVSGKIKWQGDAYTKLTAGLFRIPFGYELQESTSTLPWPERSIWANRMFPGVRDIGARVWGAAWGEKLVYQLALQNGHPIGEASFPGLDPNGFKDVTGRLGTKVGPLRAGVSGLIGRGYLAPAEDDAATPEDESHDAGGYSRWAAGADLVLTFDVAPLGELGLYSEAVYAKNLDRSNAKNLPKRVVDADGDATDEVEDANHLGAYVGAQQHLGKLFALGARYDYFDPDTDADDDQISAVTFVAHAFPADSLRLTVAYELRVEKPQVDDNQLWLRAQVKY